MLKYYRYTYKSNALIENPESISWNLYKKGKPKKLGKKKWQTEHRAASTTYPCYLPVLGEFSGSWPCRFAVAKVQQFVFNANIVI
jgi:hypothetical protein